MRWHVLAIHKVYPPKLEYLEVLVFSASGFNAGGSGLKVIRIYQREFLQDLWNSAHA